MATFEEWNERLVNFFFNLNNTGKEVRLDVDQELLDQEFDDMGGSAGFLEAVKDGPKVINRQSSLLDKFKFLFEKWFDRRENEKAYQDIPTHMPYLCLFCYAWNVGDDFNLLNYMGRLELLYPRHGLTTLTALNIFENQDYGIFDVLPTWANHRHQGCNGSLGFFHPRKIGHKDGVGWPLGQVVMSSARKNRLGFLFSSIGVNPDDDINIYDLKSRLLVNQTEATWTLGPNLFRLIKYENDGHQNLLEIIKSELHDWDGSIPVSMNDMAANTRMANCTPLILLKIHDGNFFASMTIDNDQERYPDGEFEFDLDGETIFFPIRYEGQERANFQNSARNDLDCSQRIFESLTAQGTWKNESNQSNVNLKYSSYGFIFLKPENTNQLIQVHNLPRDGILYLLLNTNDHEISGAWHQLRNNPLIQRGILQEFTPRPVFNLIRQQNANCEIWAIVGIEKLPKELLAPPLFTFNSNESTNYARLVGGYRVKSRRGRNTYFYWGPPQVSLENKEGNLILNAIDAEVKLISTKPFIHLDHTSTKDYIETYSLAPEIGKRSIQINVMQGERLIQTLYVFFLWDNDSVGQDLNNIFRVNRLGFKAEENDDSYLSGVSIHPDQMPINNALQSNTISHFPFFLKKPNEKLQLKKSNDFLTWMSDYGEKICFSDARAFVLSHEVNLYPKQQRIESGLSMIMAMRQLGHIEIETDSSGRFKYVRPMPPCLYALPFKNDQDSYYFALTGCYSSNLLTSLRESASNLGLGWFSTSQIGGGNYEKIHHLVPSLEIVHGPSNSIFDLANKNKILIVKEPPAVSIANWAGSLGDWEILLDWSSDLRQVGFEVFQNQDFCFSSGQIEQNDISLLRGKDPKTDRIDRYQLKRRTNNGMISYASVSHREWGCWYSLFKSSSPAKAFQRKLPFAYFPKDGRVVTPVLADFPYLLSKALILCSGLSPSYILSNDFSKDEKEILKNIFPCYKGMFIQFYFVPMEIAKLVFKKVFPQS